MVNDVFDRTDFPSAAFPGEIVSLLLLADPGELCACELLPLFEIAQSTLSHHLKTLVDAAVVESRRQGLFAYYLVRPQVLAELSGWLVGAAPPERRVVTASDVSSR